LVTALLHDAKSRAVVYQRLGKIRTRLYLNDLNAFLNVTWAAHEKN